nr:hypothetical protein [Escherichia coli]
MRAKAEKATCGEWSLEYGDGRFDGDDALIHREAAGYIPICRIEGAHPESGFDEDFQIEQQAMLNSSPQPIQLPCWHYWMNGKETSNTSNHATRRTRILH